MEVASANEGTRTPTDDKRATMADPTGRFERTTELLGRGASKEVYKAFDHEEGVEVAWNQLKVDNLTEQSASKILSEIQIIQSISNEHIIKFYHSWISRNAAGYFEVYFITELMTSGTLKSYLQKSKGPIKLKVIKHWCRQILKALHYLHTKSPPIIHRDLKCDNVFINGNNGQAKLGDFGLAILKNREILTSVIGTPEFMAPELYEEKYDEKVDIYAFGLCLMEMVTKDYPYSECDNAAQIFRKVTQGIKPQALLKVNDGPTRAFIEICVDPNPRLRPSVEELLNHEFMAAEDSKSFGAGISPVVSPLSALISPSEESGASLAVSPMGVPSETSTATAPDSMDGALSTTLTSTSSLSARQSSQPEVRLVKCAVEVVSRELPVLHLRMKLTMSSNAANTEVKFPFNLDSDTINAVIGEMIREGVLAADAKDTVAVAILNCLNEDRGESARSFPGESVAKQDNGVHESMTSESSRKSNSSAEPEPAVIIEEAHPEVISLVSRQKKEIELLMLFHCREHQLLVQTLRKSAAARSRSSRPPSPKIEQPPVTDLLFDGSQETLFIAKLRNLMFESTGNAAWLGSATSPGHGLSENGNADHPAQMP